MNKYITIVFVHNYKSKIFSLIKKFNFSGFFNRVNFYKYRFFRLLKYSEVCDSYDKFDIFLSATSKPFVKIYFFFYQFY